MTMIATPRRQLVGYVYCIALVSFVCAEFQRFTLATRKYTPTYGVGPEKQAPW